MDLLEFSTLFDLSDGSFNNLHVFVVPACFSGPFNYTVFLLLEGYDFTVERLLLLSICAEEDLERELDEGEFDFGAASLQDPRHVSPVMYL